MGIFGTLQLIFIVLKLVGTITWSWWAVFAPLWIYIALIIGIWLWLWLDESLHDWSY